MLQLSADWRIPLTLAVIPGREACGLAGVLAGRSHVSVIQHGVDHRNRRSGSAAGEFGPELEMAAVGERLRAGWAQLQGLPGLLPMFAPPWNDVHLELPAALRACGYSALSAWGGLGGGEPMRIDAHLDLLRWRSGVRFRGAGRFALALANALAARRRAGCWDAPIGLLTHHLDHDDEAWRFLEVFFAWSTRRREFVWRALPDLVVLPRAVAA